MPYQIVEIELSEAPTPFTLTAQQDGFALVARWQGRLAGFYMASAGAGTSVSAEQLTELCSKHFGRRLLALEIETALARRWPDARKSPAPSLSIAICTKDRAKRLA